MIAKWLRAYWPFRLWIYPVSTERSYTNSTYPTYSTSIVFRTPRALLTEFGVRRTRLLSVKTQEPVYAYRFKLVLNTKYLTLFKYVSSFFSDIFRGILFYLQSSRSEVTLMEFFLFEIVKTTIDEMNLPVSATPMMSLFWSPIGIAILWIGVGSCLEEIELWKKQIIIKSLNSKNYWSIRSEGSCN